MSTDKRNKKRVCIQVLHDKKSGRVFAAGPVSVQAIGEDAPKEFRLIPGDDGIQEEIELTHEQAVTPPPELFATHVVRNGRLVRIKGAKSAGLTRGR